jgi:hypothetical protein
MKVNGPLHTLTALPRGKYYPVPLGRRLSGSQSRSGRRGVEKIFCPCRESNLNSIYFQLIAVAILTELSRKVVYSAVAFYVLDAFLKTSCISKLA